MGLFNFKKEKDIETQYKELKAKESLEMADNMYYFLRGYMIHSKIQGEVRKVEVVNQEANGYHIGVYVTNKKDFIGVGGKNVQGVCVEVQKEFGVKVQLDVRLVRE